MNILLILISVILFIVSIGQLRNYIRSSQIGVLLMAFGSFILSIALILDVPYANFTDLNIYILLAGYIIFQSGFLLHGSKESGTRKYIMTRTTILQRLLGSVPIVKDEIKPSLKRKYGILIGLLTIGLGLLFILLRKMFNLDASLPLTFIFLNILWGIIMIILSFAYGSNCTRV